MSQANGSNGKQRRQFSAEEKATILRRQLADKVAVSDLCRVATRQRRPSRRGH